MNGSGSIAGKRTRELYPLPRIATTQLRWFVAYLRFFFRRHFHAVRLLKVALPESLDGWPLLVCLNHPSWWDPLFALYLSQRFFGNRRNYGPVASAGISKYSFFERLGFFGIDAHSATGTARFLRIGESVLSRSDGAFWVTAQGRFTDARIRPITFQSGVGYLAHRMTRFAMLPLALEYSFWEERTPEALLCFGEPIYVEAGSEKTAAEWAQVFAQRLEQTQDLLARSGINRQVSNFETLIKGRAGIGGVYDLWRAFKARIAGKPFRREHGSY
jgi:1-acyl-sn-glycerol-3-phosphate acyltransferase